MTSPTTSSSVPHNPTPSASTATNSASTSSNANTSPASVVLSTPPPLLTLVHHLPFLNTVLSFMYILNWRKGYRVKALAVVVAWTVVCVLGRVGVGLATVVSVLVSRRRGNGKELEVKEVEEPEEVVRRLVILDKLKEEFEYFADPSAMYKSTSPTSPSTSNQSSISITSPPPIPAVQQAVKAVQPRTLLVLLLVPFILSPHLSLLLLGLSIFLFRSPITPSILNLSAFWITYLSHVFSQTKSERSQLSIKTLLRKKRGEGDADSKVGREGREKRELLVVFTVLENQRWWVGLDWTAALLPNERASWADIHNNPVSPPSSFELPPSTVLTTPAPTSKSPTRTTRKTLEWKWLDDDWVVKSSSDSRGRQNEAKFEDWKNALKSNPRDGTPDSIKEKNMVATSSESGLLQRQTTPITANSSASTDTSSVAGEKKTTLTTTTANLATSAISNYIASSLIPSSMSNPAWIQFSRSQTTSSTESNLTSLESVATGNTDVFNTWEVDNEGWQYGDNHWEKLGSKGGLGRYTRRRAWWRRAVLTEVVEVVEGKIKEKKDKEGHSNKKRRSSSKTAKPKFGLTEKEKEKLKSGVIDEEEESNNESMTTSLRPPNEGKEGQTNRQRNPTSTSIST